jgi:Tol biopolymer transport system component
MRCLAKRPADRWQSAAELAQQLESLTTPTGGMTPTHTRPIAAVTPARRKLIPVLMVAGVAVIALAVALSLGKKPERPEFGRQVQFTHDAGLEFEAALSPDGKFVAYVVNDSGAFRLMVRQIDGGEAVTISSAFRFPSAPQWSPDGSRILFLSERGIEVIPSLGGRSQLLVPRNSRLILVPGSWASTGSEFVYARADSILIRGADGTSRLVTEAREPHSLAWSPNGKWIAFVSGNREYRIPGIAYGNTAPSRLMLVPAAGGTAQEASLGEAQNLSPAWLSDRTLLFISSRDGARDVYSLSLGNDGKPGSTASRITTGLNAILLSLSPASRKVVYTVYEERSNVWSIPADAAAPLSISQATQVTTGNQTIERFSVSPDGRHMVYDSDRSGNSDLYLLNLATGETDQLISDSIAQFAPTWSPDGQEIAYHAIINGVRQIFLMGEGGNPTQITNGTDDLRTPIWAGNGRALYVGTNVPNNGYVARMDRQEDGTWGPGRRVFRAGSASPDERLVFTGRIIMTMDGTDTLRQVVPATVPTVRNGNWSRDGAKVYYLAGDASDRTTEIWSVTVPGWTPRLHVRFDDPARPWHRFGFQVHGNRIYLTLGERESDIWAADINLTPGR